MSNTTPMPDPPEPTDPEVPDSGTENDHLQK